MSRADYFAFMRSLSWTSRRFFEKVIIPSDVDACWVWSARKTADGYGLFKFPGGWVPAHRALFKIIGIPLVSGLTIDHLCCNRACVNPSHLRQVTNRENILADHSSATAAMHSRKSHCPQGHAYSVENTYIWNRGRACRECKRIRAREKAERQRSVNSEKEATV